jgi:hypothetical protein
MSTVPSDPGVALFSGPVPYYGFRAVYGGPVASSRGVGHEALALAEAEAAQGAA